MSIGKSLVAQYQGRLARQENNNEFRCGNGGCRVEIQWTFTAKIDRHVPGRYFPARLCTLDDASESWALEMVERHLSMNWQGFRGGWSRPNERLVVRRLGQHARESPSHPVSWVDFAETPIPQAPFRREAYLCEQMFPAAGRPSVAGQRPCCERTFFVNVVDEVVDEFPRQHKHMMVVAARK